MRVGEELKRDWVRVKWDLDDIHAFDGRLANSRYCDKTDQRRFPLESRCMGHNSNARLILNMLMLLH